jgi:L-iditol 2-dehydrogenase
VRVAVYYSNRDVRLEERSRPVPGPGEILMKVEASGICGSDVMEWYRIRKAPCVLGHEVAGVVAETGPGVARLRAGDRIVATHHVPCGTCRYCLTGRESVCKTLRATHFDPGGFSEFIRLPAINVERGTLKLPDSVTSDEASFVEPLACVVRAHGVARVVRGQSVLVIGSGISGVLHIQHAKALGAGPVIATDPSPYRRDAARLLGADAVFDAGEDLPEKVRAANGGRLAEQVLVCTGALPAIAQALRCVDRGGTILFFAPAAPGETFPMPLLDLWSDGIALVHSYAGPPAEMRLALDLIASKRLDVRAMVTHRLPLSRAQEGFDLVARAADSLKVILDPRL